MKKVKWVILKKKNDTLCAEHLSKSTCVVMPFYSPYGSYWLYIPKTIFSLSLEKDNLKNCFTEAHDGARPIQMLERDTLFCIEIGVPDKEGLEKLFNKLESFS